MISRARLFSFPADAPAVLPTLSVERAPSRLASCLSGGLVSLFLVAHLLSGCAATAPNGPVRWELTPEAELTYATLLMDQSLRNDDRAGVLEAADILLQRGTRVQHFVDAAAWLMINKDRDEARALLEKAVQRFPDDLGLHMLLAETWIEQGENDKAVSVLLTYQKRRPNSEMIRQEIGILYVKTGLYQQADTVFSALPLRLRTPFVRYCHAQALTALGQLDKAVRQLEIAVRENPEFLEAWFELAKNFELQKKYAQAVEIYSSLTEQDPGNQDIWIRLVTVELRAGKPTKALETARSGPESFGFQLTAATLLLDEKCFVEAEALLNDIQNMSDAPDEVNFYLAAVAYEYYRDMQKTLDFLSAIPAGNRFYDRSLRLRAQLLYDMGQPVEALALIREGKALLPADREFHLMEIQLLLNIDRIAESLEAADAALITLPNDVELQTMRGSILDALGRKSEAFSVMEEVVARNPDMVQALNYVGYTLAEQNRELERAVALLRRAVKLEPDRAYVLDSLAWALFRKGEVPEAWKFIHRAANLPDGGDAAIWEHYGDIAAAFGDSVEARRGWNKALTLNPAEPEKLRKKLGNK